MFWFLQILNGITFGMLLFMLAAGLSLIYGLMDIVNLAHGSFYMVSAYVAVFIGLDTGNFILAILAGAVTSDIIGILMYFSLLRPYAENVLNQVLLTLGCLFIMGDVALHARW